MTPPLALIFLLAYFFQVVTSQCPEGWESVNGQCQCWPPSVLHEGSCRLICPEGQYLDYKSNSCQSCSPGCNKCWGPEQNQCLSCSTEILYNPFTQRCETSGICEVGANSFAGFCTLQECSNQEDSRPYIFTQSRFCASECAGSNDEIISGFNGVTICDPGVCHESCGTVEPGLQKKRCLAQQTPGTCLTCDSSKNALYVSTTFDSQYVYDCVDSVPSNTYFLESRNGYFFCNSQCATCSGNPDTCVTCADSSKVLVDGTCQSECRSRFFASPDPETSQMTCYPCDESCASCQGSKDRCTACSSESAYLYSDGRCLDTCSADLYEVREQNGQALCVQKRTAINPSDEGTSTGTTANGDEEEENEELFVKRVSEYNQVSGAVISLSVAGLQMLRPASCSTASTILLVNLLQYVRYLDMNYPSKLVSAFKKQTEVSLNFGPLFPESLEDEAMEYETPSRFTQFNVFGLFLANFWRGVTTSIILGIGVCFAILLNRINTKNDKFIMIRGKLQGFLAWNYILTFLLSNLDKVTMYGIIEYRNLNLDSGFSILSFVLNLIFLIGSLMVLGYIPTKLHRIRKEGKYKSKEDKIKEFEHIKVLIEKPKDKYFIQEIFLFMIGLRAILHNIIIAAIDSPTIQASLLLTLSVLMLVYFVIFRPHSQLLDNIELIVYEAILVIVNCTCIYISTLEYSEQNTAIGAGSTIIVCNITIYGFSMIMSVLKVLVQLLKIIKEKLAERKKKAAESKPAAPAVKNETDYEMKNSIKENKEVSQENLEDEEQDKVQTLDDESISLDGVMERDPKETAASLSHFKVNPSSQAINTQEYPSLGIPEENLKTNKIQKYFVDRPTASIGSLNSVKRDSKTSLL